MQTHCAHHHTMNIYRACLEEVAFNPNGDNTSKYNSGQNYLRINWLIYRFNEGSILGDSPAGLEPVLPGGPATSAPTERLW